MMIDGGYVAYKKSQTNDAKAPAQRNVAGFHYLSSCHIFLHAFLTAMISATLQARLWLR
jgi:hypothetical protein